MVVQGEPIKLGITVIYLVSEENEELLDLHLRQIEKHTTVPYTIYGVAVRLAPRLRAKLEANSNIHLCDIPETSHRWTPEHSYYLTHLVQAAIDDGATHVVTLHVDSFPIKTGWAKELANRISDTCVLATVNDTFTACLFFPRSFYIDHKPAFRLSEEERSSPAYAKYDERYEHISHSGIGFLFKVFTTDNLSWYKLDTSDRRIYGKMIFHFGGTTTHKFNRVEGHNQLQTLKHQITRSLGAAVKRLRSVVPSSIHPLLPARVRRLRKHTRSAEMTELLDDPDTYLSKLLKSEKGTSSVSQP